jgi:hypothetical protein
VEGEVLVNAAEASNEVVFECADGAFGSVSAMYAGWGELKVNVFFLSELFQGLSTFIVKALEAGAEFRRVQFGMEVLISGKDGSTCAVLDGFGEDTVAVIVVDD